MRAASSEALKTKLGGVAPVGTLEVNPPAAFDTAWSRDGLTEKPPAGIGEKAFWVSQLLALVPPAHWERRLGAEPEALVEAAANGEWAEPVLRGWVNATISFGARSWAAPLLRGQDGAPSSVERRADLAARIFPLMNQEAAESFVAPLVSARNTIALIPQLVALPTPWSPPFGDVVLDALEHILRVGPQSVMGSYTWRAAIERAATALPPACFARGLALDSSALPEDPDAAALRSPLEAFRSVLTIRQRIHEETRP